MRVTLLPMAVIPLWLGCASAPPVESVPETDEVVSPALSAPVDVVRDEQGIPHIYGRSFADVAFAQGYVMAQDRLVQMDLARHLASGTLAELVGELSPSILDQDVAMRAQHLRSTAQASFEALQASTNADDRELVSAFTKFAAGVNAYLEDLQSGRYSLPGALLLVYDPMTAQPWSEVDSIVIGLYVAFALSFDASSDLGRSQLDETVKARFELGGTPELISRKGLARDLEDLRPIDPTYTLPGDFSTLGPIARASGPGLATGALALYQADRPSVLGLGNDRTQHPSHGSNNWVIGPQLSSNGHVLVANDPHLQLQNPATFYLLHLVVRGDHPIEVSGAEFPGAPGVILGHNRHVAWAATTSALDVTDVYRETIVPCDSAPQAQCVVWNGQQVPLQPRHEQFQIGRFGHIQKTLDLTLYDVPHHGPILPRVTATHDGLEPLGSTELSVRWTGHEPSQLLSAVYGLDKSGSVREAAQALEQHFRVGGQNWVLGDDQGHFGWTQAVRVPRRPAGTQPWKVLPGDGSAEWLGDLDLAYVPHAFDPEAGFLATANADPVGVTDDGDPFGSEPLVDGLPLYIGADFDPGTRVGRITKRIKELAAVRKLSVLDLQAIQADDVSEWDQRLAPTLLDGLQALAEELAAPGTHPEVTPVAEAADPPSRAALPMARELLASWDFSTRADSVAATLFNVWVTRFALLAFEDETDVLGSGFGQDASLKLLVRMCEAPEQLATGLSTTGDALLFDDLNTPEVVEGKRFAAAKAFLDMVDYLVPVLGEDPTTWQWGRLHTLTLAGLLPLDALDVPTRDDPEFPSGFPRHGDNGTVDVGGHGLAVDDFTYGAGPVIRAVYDLDPEGPKVKNALPGGEVFDPGSPHYRDLMELWRKNETFDQVFEERDVTESARREQAKTGVGRVRFRAR